MSKKKDAAAPDADPQLPPVTAAELEAQTGPGYISDAEVEEWNKTVVVGDENVSDFLVVPKPDPRFYYSWLNANSQNMQRRSAMGWRPVPPEHCERIGISPYQRNRGTGYAQVYDAILCFIPRKKVDEYNERIKNQRTTSPEQLPAIQKLMNMQNKGVTPFMGDAREVAEFHKWRLNRRGFVSYSKPSAT